MFERASNTQDVLVARTESTNQDGLDRLMTKIYAHLEASGIEAVEGGH